MFCPVLKNKVHTKAERKTESATTPSGFDWSAALVRNVVTRYRIPFVSRTIRVTVYKMSLCRRWWRRLPGSHVTIAVDIRSSWLSLRCSLRLCRCLNQLVHGHMLISVYVLICSFPVVRRIRDGRVHYPVPLTRILSSVNVMTAKSTREKYRYILSP